MKVQMLINAGLDKNQMFISEAAAGLSDSQKQMLYMSNQKTVGGSFALNLLLGLGIGSFVQGDIAGGSAALSGELGGILVLTIGGYSGTGPTIPVLGLLTMLGFRVFECIRPFTFSKSYNQKLANSLNVYAVSFDAAPVISADGGTEFAMAAKIRL